MAERQNCAVLGIVHLNKTQGLAPLARAGGSGASATQHALCCSIAIPTTQTARWGPRRVLAHIKCNVGPEAASLLYALEEVVLPASGGQPEVETSRLKLLGE
jgi:hypothetical protein